MVKGKKNNSVDDGILTSNRVTRSKSLAHKKFLESSINNEDEFPVLKRLQLYPSSIKGDGNCLFRSLSDQYYGDNGNNHQEIRQEIVNYMTQHCDYFSLFLEGSDIGESWPSYIRRMAKDGVYGDNLEIVAFARRYKSNVMIYQNDFMYVVSCRGGVEEEEIDDSDVREVHIAYHTWEHYSSVRNINGPHSGLPYVKPEVNEEDDNNGSSNSTSNDIPKWQIDAVKRSIPYPATDEVDKLIIKLLKKHNSNDITKTVEEIIMMDDGNGELLIQQEDDNIEFTTESINSTIKSTASSIPNPPTLIASLPSPSPPPPSSPKSTNKRIASSPLTKEPTPPTTTTTTSSPHRPKKLTPRERKEKQKKAAAERKKANRSRSTTTAPISDASSPSTPNGIRTMYI